MISTIGLALLTGLVLLMAMWLWERKERILWQLEVERLQEDVERLQEEVHTHKELASVDALTGLPNRRALDRGSQRMHAELMRYMGTSASQAAPRELVVILMDVFRFKKVNDTQGHQAGDELLKDIAKGLSETFRRPTDLVGRLSGDEFIAFLELQGNEEEVAHQIGEIEQQLNELFSRIHRVDVGSVTCGFSTGTPIGLEEAMNEADIRMYAVKGKDR